MVEPTEIDGKVEYIKKPRNHFSSTALRRVMKDADIKAKWASISCAKLPNISCLKIAKVGDELPRKVKTVGVIPNILSFQTGHLKKLKHDMRIGDDADDKIIEEPEDDEVSEVKRG